MGDPAPARARVVVLAYAVAAIAFLADLVTKMLAVRHLRDHGPVHVVGDLLQLELARNPGAAFSTGTSHTRLISVVAIVAALVVIWYLRKVGSLGWAIAMGLLLAGILGNLADRLFREPGPFRGHVVDFIALPHWPVFNVADMCINVAAVLILVLALRGIRFDGGVSSAGDSVPASAGEQRSLVVPEGVAGERVDSGLAKMFGLSRTRAAELVTSGLVSVDGRAAAKSDRLLPGSTLEVTIPEERDRLEVTEELVAGVRIIYQDEAIVVVDKPVGVAVHPSMGWTGPTLVGHLRAAGIRIATSGASERQGIVQRLDVGTSGVMVICKGEHAYAVLKNAFRKRTVDKTYHALVQGHPDPLEGTVDAPIARHNTSDWRFAVREDGKHSITHYKTLEAHRFASLLEVHLETGRTHQIRVHMSALKHPCVGDLTYGADPTLARRLGLERQWLHAVELGFEHPETGKYVTYESPYPVDLAHALEVVRDG